VTGQWMWAAVAHRPGGPDVLRVERLPRPRLRAGWVLVRIAAFGLNRAEVYTRQGHSPSVEFPRVLGIECVGTVEESGSSRVEPGMVIAGVAGGMGREFDGGYAEYGLLPESHVIPLNTALDWPTLAALPETYLTAAGSLDNLRLRPGDRLVIRGATSSVGVAALTLARVDEPEIACTTRNPAKVEALRALGAHHVVVDDGDLPRAISRLWPGGADRVLDLVGGVAVLDGLRLLAEGGVLCHTGILSGTWRIPDFEPLEAILPGTYLTTFSNRTISAVACAHRLQGIVDDVGRGLYRPVIDRVFTLDRIADAHRHMESNRAVGKIVVVTEAGGDGG
jgi:NADPH:quinone reductase-like Zn-dependent oxidoreductase